MSSALFNIAGKQNVCATSFCTAGGMKKERKARRRRGGGVIVHAFSGRYQLIWYFEFHQTKKSLQITEDFIAESCFGTDQRYALFIDFMVFYETVSSVARDRISLCLPHSVCANRIA